MFEARCPFVRATAFAAIAGILLAACGVDVDADAADEATPQNGRLCTGADCEVTPTSTDGAKNGDETDVDCGGASAPECVDGKACSADTDCASAYCKADAKICAPPRPDDGVKNADETDIDCGGASGKKCEAGKGCKAHADCASDGCRDGVCAIGKSCRGHWGGATCGSGEPGTPDAKHEDCCTWIDVPRPENLGGPYRLDKYLITAGRMRAFIEAVGNDVKTWAKANPPPGWDETHEKSVPGNAVDVAQQLGGGQAPNTDYYKINAGPGCYAAANGSPAYWLSKEDQETYNGDIERQYTKDELDTKVINCVTRALVVAFCHWDGGRLPTYDEWKYAWNAGDASRWYPWGNKLPIGDYANYNHNYAWPRYPGPDDLDFGAYLTAPGRFPQGAGPFGHMDLAGAVETFGTTAPWSGYVAGGWMQYSFQEAGREQYNIRYGAYPPTPGWLPRTKHFAIGGRCARPLL